MEGCVFLLEEKAAGRAFEMSTPILNCSWRCALDQPRGAPDLNREGRRWQRGPELPHRERETGQRGFGGPGKRGEKSRGRQGWRPSGESAPGPAAGLVRGGALRARAETGRCSPACPGACPSRRDLRGLGEDGLACGRVAPPGQRRLFSGTCFRVKPPRKGKPGD